MVPEDLADAQIDDEVAQKENARTSRRDEFMSEMYEGLKGPTASASAQQRRSTKRNLTREVQTRVYRSPEVILTCRNYDEKIDCWSMGCILGELLTLMHRGFVGPVALSTSGSTIDRPHQHVRYLSR